MQQRQAMRDCTTTVRTSVMLMFFQVSVLPSRGAKGSADMSSLEAPAWVSSLRLSLPTTASSSMMTGGSSAALPVAREVAVVVLSSVISTGLEDELILIAEDDG